MCDLLQVGSCEFFLLLPPKNVGYRFNAFNVLTANVFSTVNVSVMLLLSICGTNLQRFDNISFVTKL